MSLTADQLAAKNYPQEYWMNCYNIDGKHDLGARHGSKEKAEDAAAYVWDRFLTERLYRIHVRLK